MQGFQQKYRKLLLYPATLVGLYLASRYDYNLFHCIVEGACIVISSGIFILSWNSRKFANNNYIVVVGIGCLFLAILLFLHTLSYKGMNIFHGYDANLPTQLWIAVRWVGGLTFVMAPLCIARKIQPGRLLWVASVIVLLVVLSIFWWKIFPDCYLEGTGLTLFKRLNEIFVVGLYAISIILLLRTQDHFEPEVLRKLILSIIFNIGAGMSYIFYVSVFGFSNLIGHYLHLVSFYILYQAVIEIGLSKPYALLLRNQQQVELALKKSEQKFRTIADFSYDWDGWIAPDGSYLYVSPSCERITGYPPEKFVDDSNFLMTIVHPDDRQRVARHREKHLNKNAGPAEITYRIIMKNSDIRWIWHQCQPVYSKDGVWLGRRASNRDVTQKHEIETNLQQEREMFLHGPVITFTWRNADSWPVELISGNVSDILGFQVEDFLSGQIDYKSIIHPEDRTEVIEEVEQQCNKGANSFIHGPFRLLQKDGEPIWVLNTTSIVRDEYGVVTRFRGYLVDITHQKLQEEILLEKTKKLAELKRYESLKTMAGAIAHRFNNSMTAVIGNLDLLSRNLVDNKPKEKEMVAEALQAANGAVRVGSMMLSYVGQCQLEQERCNLVELVRESLDELGSKVPSSISLVVEEPESPLYCQADRKQIEEVLNCLITNSVESYDGGEGTIKVSFGLEFCERTTIPLLFQDDFPEGGMYSYCMIEDQGQGISKEYMQHIFEPFFTTRFIGRGLGLALAAGIVRAHNGAILVDSEPGQGTRVKVLLPTRSAPELQTKHVTQASLSGNVLLVDDEDIVIGVGKRMLEILGMQVSIARNGMQAVEIIKKGDVDIKIVILDLAMPEMDGIEAMHRMKVFNPHLKILLSSGFAAKDVPHFKELQQDADGFLKKPFQLAALQQCLEEILSA